MSKSGTMCEDLPAKSRGLGAHLSAQWSASDVDVRLIRRAIREGWPVDPRISSEIIDAVMSDGQRSRRPRTQLRAARLGAFIFTKSTKEQLRRPRPDPLHFPRKDNMGTTPTTLSEVLRHAILVSGLRINKLATKAKVERKSIERFASGRGGITMAAADRLAEVLGLELKAKEAKP